MMATYSYVKDNLNTVEHPYIGRYIKIKNIVEHYKIIADEETFWKLNSGSYLKKIEENTIWKLIEKSNYVGKIIENMDGQTIGLVEYDEENRLRIETGGSVKKIHEYDEHGFNDDDVCEQTWKIRSDQKYKIQYIPN